MVECRINCSHPLAINLKYAWIFGATGYREILNSIYPSVLGSNAALSGGDYAPSSTTDFYGTNNTIALNASAGLTLATSALWKTSNATGAPNYGQNIICDFQPNLGGAAPKDDLHFLSFYNTGTITTPSFGFNWDGGITAADREILQGAATNQNQFYSIAGAHKGGSTDKGNLFVNSKYVVTSTNDGALQNPARYSIGHYRASSGTGGYLNGIIRYVYAWERVLADSELFAIHENPWQLLTPHPSRFFLIPDAAGGGSDLAGAATAQATATGAITTQIPMVAAALSIATATGSLTTGISLAGSAAEITVASGVLTAQIQLSGAALAQATASGSVTTQIRLSGAALAQALATAGLTASPSGLAGDATAQAAASAGLTTQIPLAGSASAVASSSAALTTAIRLYGAAAQVSAATGDLTVSSGTVLDAHALAQATAGGSLMTQIKLDAYALAQALATGALSGAVTWTPSTQRTLTALRSVRRLTALRSVRRLLLPAMTRTL